MLLKHHGAASPPLRKGRKLKAPAIQGMDPLRMKPGFSSSMDDIRGAPRSVPMTIAERSSPEKILVISTNLWPSAGRIAIALHNVGFCVAILSLGGSPVRQIRKGIDAFFVYRRLRPMKSIMHAIVAWSPSLLVCADDKAVRSLHELHRWLSKRSDPKSKSGANLIERSLGPPDSFQVTSAKSATMAVAQSIGLRCPQTIAVANRHALQAASKDLNYPIVVKADDSYGGLGVRVAQSEQELRAAVPEVLLPNIFPSILRRWLGPLSWNSYFRWCSRWHKKINLQSYIEGQPANCAVASWRGVVFGTINVKAIKTSTKLGPATMVEIVENTEMTSAAEKLIVKLNLSGFVGLDFIIDPFDQAWLIEMNARVTPICHLCLEHENLPAALSSFLLRSKPKIDLQPMKQKTIGLFPGSIKQTEVHEIDSSSYIDIPRDEPDFVAACLRVR